jgi:hypothetical protein
VLVDQVDREQQVAPCEDLGRRAVGDDPVLLAEDEAPVGEAVEGVEVVGLPA